MTEDLIPLAELVLEGFGATVYGATIDSLAARLGDEVTLDDIGRRCCTRQTARRLFAQRAEDQAIRQQREGVEKEQRQAETDRRRQAEYARQVRAEMQKEALRENPQIDALTLSKLVGEDGLSRMDRKGEEMASMLRGESSGTWFGRGTG